MNVQDKVMKKYDTRKVFVLAKIKARPSYFRAVDSVWPG